MCLHPPRGALLPEEGNYALRPPFFISPRAQAEVISPNPREGALFCKTVDALTQLPEYVEFRRRGQAAKNIETLRSILPSGSAAKLSRFLRQMPDPNRTGVENQAFHINAFIVGGMQSSLGIVYDEDELVSRLKQIQSDMEGIEPA